MKNVLNQGTINQKKQQDCKNCKPKVAANKANAIVKTLKKE